MKVRKTKSQAADQINQEIDSIDKTMQRETRKGGNCETLQHTYVNSHFAHGYILHYITLRYVTSQEVQNCVKQVEIE